MLRVYENIIYKAFGLSIISEIPFLELPILDKNVCTNDIEIKIKDLTKLWAKASGKPYDFVFDKNLVIFNIPDVGTFEIKNGKTISVSPFKDADQDLIRLFILGTCMGAILLQRETFPLHGSAIEINGMAIAIVGDSGAGKSTLASAFLEQGYKLLSDDVIAISINPRELVPYVFPSYPQQKLWEDSLNSFGMDKGNFRSIYGREKKYSIPVSSYCSEPLPLVGVFELVKSENSLIEISHIEKLERFQTLYYHTYRNFFIKNLGLMDWHFRVSANIMQNAGIYRLKRPESLFSASQLVHKILNTVN